jgi:6-phosphofructokinase 1
MPSRLAVLTSGGDSAGMNAAVRAVVRTAFDAELDVFGVYEGLQGLVDGGDHIRALTSADVGGILQVGGTVLGTARSVDFRTRPGRRQAARNLVERGIDALVVIGGDGSLSGAAELRAEWAELLDELVDEGTIERARADAHRDLALVGLVGSIDNDMVGTDMTIGVDTALHRITEAVDAIQSTASSHQRTFVIEVMGRNCGYLALMGGLATGANYVLIPENPPGETWQDDMCDVLSAGRRVGRRASIVLVAEGTRDSNGDPVTAEQVRSVLKDRLGEDVRVTVLGHVQRGGAPSAFDRYLGTVLGYAAVRQLIDEPDVPPQLIGIRGHRVVSSPLLDCVATTRSIAGVIAERDGETAMQLRGGSFQNSFLLLRTMTQVRPRRPDAGHRALRLAVLHAGGPAPGMNTAVRVAVRMGMDRGHTLLAVRDGFRGLAEGRIEEMSWMSVSGWVSRPGAELGTSRFRAAPGDAARIATQLADHAVDGLLVIGGWAGYATAHELAARSREHPALDIPIVCVPASINNNLPASDLSIGADTALNSITTDVDKIKQSAVALHRCFVVEVMGRDCGYLALLGGLATGAERVYLPEEGITLARLQTDLDELLRGFDLGKRLGLVIRGERADRVFTTGFIESLLAHESGNRFDVRQAILGHVQQGGAPSPFDRIHATRLASAGIDRLINEVSAGGRAGAMVGIREGKVEFTPLERFPELTEDDVQRPRGPAWWMALRPLADLMATARPGPSEARDPDAR